METPGLSETVQLANILSNFLGQLGKLAVDGTNTIFRGSGQLAKGSYVLLKFAAEEHEKAKNNPNRFKNGEYSMSDMIRICNNKGVTPVFMRLKNDPATIDKFTRFAKDNKLAYSILPDLNTHDEYIEIMYPSTQSVQYKSFMNNINKQTAFNISFNDYLENMDAEKEMDIRKIIDNLSEEEKKLINDSANKAVKADKEQEEIQVHETYIDISDAQIISKDDKTIKVALLDNAGRDCILTVDAAAANKTDYGYRINLNHKEPLEYTTMTEIRINKNDVARETSGQIITGIPNTNGEKYVGIDKRNCVFSDDEIVYNLNKSEKYIVLDRNFNFVKELDGESIYKGHFDKKMIQSEDIVKYNTNYHKVNEINLKVPQPQEVKNLQSDFIVFEIPASMISISGIDQLAIKMADDTVAVDKSDILMVEHEGQQKYFMKVSKDKTYQTAANARVSATQLTQYIRSDTCKTKETAVETKEKELQPDKEGQRKEVQHKEVRR